MNGFMNNPVQRIHSSFRIIYLTSFLLGMSFITEAQEVSPVISFQITRSGFPLSVSGNSTSIVVSEADYPGVIRIARYFQDDVKKVTGVEPEVVLGTIPKSGEIVVVGTIGKSLLIDQLVKKGKINVSDIKRKWETSLIQVVEKPFPGVKRALVVAGSDKRGTIFGMFELSRQMGISPWYWWSDVPVQPHSAVYVNAGRFVFGEPKVKYRGIFLNDEEPALGRWAVEKYGGFNHQMYEKVFELILRLKGNYLWPAMWWASFNSNDPMNPELADEMGIVMGTTHHEPMMRAHAEWKPYGGGDWNYETNPEQLRKFWTEGIQRMGNRESIVTLAMRGDGDMAMSEGTNRALLEKIVADQRKIITEVTGKNCTEIPQLWALYKEVQDYYDRGMRVPDDVTLLLCDDNWGNIRKLPKPGTPPRAGGYGIYYHFDYVGGPRNYKWLNTCPLPAVWEQMHMAYEHGVDRIWLVNVGDLKPMELPISFFLDYAWNPDQWPAEKLSEYTRMWAKEQFGPPYAGEIAEMLDLYTKYNGRRKPELITPETYSLTNFREAETISADYNKLAVRAEKLSGKMSAEFKDAFYELVLHPITACANLNDLYVTVAKNRLYSKQGRSSTNELAQNAKDLFQKDADITNYYHVKLAGGKWNHMMAQTHIGYSYWQQPEKNSIPEVAVISLPDSTLAGVAIEGSSSWWPKETTKAVLPVMDSYNKQTRYIEVFCRGKKPVEFKVKSSVDWLKTEPSEGKTEKEERIWVRVDWTKVPKGKSLVPITVSTNGSANVIVYADVFNPEIPEKEPFEGFIESEGYVSMEAEHFSRKVENEPIHWQIIPGLGRTLSGITVFPVTSGSRIPTGNSPHLEYDMYLFNSGKVKVNACLSPTQNIYNSEGLKLAVSFDNEKPQILNIHAGKILRDWEESVSNNVTLAISEHMINKAGKHVLKVWMVDAGIVIQKLTVQTGNTKPSYLGAPESYFRQRPK